MHRRTRQQTPHQRLNNMWSSAVNTGRYALIGIHRGLKHHGKAIEQIANFAAVPLAAATGNPSVGFGVAAAGKVAASYSDIAKSLQA